MTNKPIGPTAHGIIDYTYTAMQAAAPVILQLKGTERTLCYTFAGIQTVLSVLTDYPLGVKRVVPFRIHGKLETPILPALVIVPWVLGAFKKPKARNFFLSMFGISVATYFLTDFKGLKPGIKRKA